MKIKNGLSLLGILSLVIFLFAFKNTDVIVEKTTTPEWKNLKVLPKDISEENLKGLMRGYNTALGVKCNYCHTEIKDSDKLDFAADTKKEKEYARHMITMTKKLNAENFNWENDPNPDNVNVVTCTMCHRGNPSATKSLELSIPKK